MTATGDVATRSAPFAAAPRDDPTCTVSALENATEWDEFVSRTASASFAHLAGWRDVIEATGGHECRYRVARARDGRIAAVLPLVRLRSPLFGRHLVSVPFLNYGGPAGELDASVALVNDAMSQACALRASSLVLRSRHRLPGADESARKLTVLLDLAPTVDEMWEQRFNSKHRTKIKRPMRDGMATTFGADQLDAFYEVWSHNMRDLGTPALPRAFFERIVSAFPSLVVIGATRLKGRPVSAGFGFIWRDEFEMTWSSGLSQFDAAKPNMLLYWDFMRELIGRGVRVFNFGRSTPGSGPHKFKQAWGGVDVPLPWIEYGGGGAQGTRDSDALKLATHVWQRLPLPVASRLGPLVSPHLPWW